ncbi:hypothetical protein BaRGS_00011993, partial [Batillaria attramentaria]
MEGRGGGLSLLVGLLAFCLTAIRRGQPCPNDFVVTGKPGRNCAVVRWNTPDGGRDRTSGDYINGGCWDHSRIVWYGDDHWCEFTVTVKIIRCSSLRSFSNGYRRCTGDEDNVYGSVCTHSCNAGYKLRGGNSVVTCQRNWKWDGPLPRCYVAEPPDLNTCRVSVTDSRGNSKFSTNVGILTNCDSQQDEAVNTIPAEVYFVIKADLNLNVGSSLPYYVSGSNVGIVAAKISLEKETVQGHRASVKEVNLNGPPYCQESVSSTNPVLKGSLHDCEGTITVDNLRLSDGESLCANMEASAGGFYNLRNEYYSSKGTETFRKVPKSKRVCFLYDPTKPVHCSQTDSWCSSTSDSMLQLSTRLTRTPNISAQIQGWLDPVPTGGLSRCASGIIRYRLEVHGVDINGASLNVQHNARNDHTVEWDASTGGLFAQTVFLPEEDDVRLYALILEVHDKAGNVAYARRLVLYDNNSTVLINSSASFQVVSANPSSSRAKRQVNMTETHFCLNWNGRFYNSELYQNNFLLPVNPDTGRQIHGDYDQQSGLLPVTGTDNVRGIVRFEIALGVDGSPEPTFEAVPDVHAESACLSEPMTHTETYRVWVRATDVMGNFEDDSVRLKVDLDGNAFLFVDTPGDKTGSTQHGLIIGGVIGAIALVSVAVIVIVII